MRRHSTTTGTSFRAYFGNYCGFGNISYIAGGVGDMWGRFFQADRVLPGLGLVGGRVCMGVCGWVLAGLSAHACMHGCMAMGYHDMIFQ